MISGRTVLLTIVAGLALEVLPAGGANANESNPGDAAVGDERNLTESEVRSMSTEQLRNAISGGVTIDSELFEVFSDAPDFHYAPLWEGADQRLNESTSREVVVGDLMSPMVSWLGCEYSGKVDYPHVTNREASVHGYWVKQPGNVNCPSKAVVTADLQAWACSSTLGCTWVTQETRFGTYTSGGGSGNWATPHKACATTTTVGWRGRVDVDLVGMLDPFGYQYGVEKDLSCHP